MRRRLNRTLAALLVTLEFVRIESEIVFVRIEVGRFEKLRPSTVKKVELFLTVGDMKSLC